MLLSFPNSSSHGWLNHLSWRFAGLNPAPISLILLLIGLTEIGFTEHGHAADKRLHWSLISRVEHNNNAFYTVLNKQYLAQSVLQPSVRYDYGLPTLQASLNASSSVKRYSNTQFDRNDHRLSANLEKHFLKSRINANLAYTEQSILETSFFDSGLFSSRPVNTASSSLNWFRQLNERNTIQLNSSFVRRDYDSERLADYSFGNASLTLNCQISPYNFLLLRINTDNYESEFIQTDRRLAPPVSLQINNDSVSTGGLVGLQYKVSEKINLSILHGSSHVKTTQTSFRFVNLDQPPVFDVLSRENNTKSSYTQSSLTYNRQKSQWQLAYNNTLSPSGNGLLLERRSSKLDYQRMLSKRKRLGVSFNHTEQDQINSDILGLFNLRRDYQEVSFFWVNQFTRLWEFRLSGRYRVNKNRPSSRYSEAAIAMIQLQYQPKAIVW